MLLGKGPGEVEKLLQQQRSLAGAGLAAKLVDVQELRRLEPALQVHDGDVGLLLPSDAQLVCPACLLSQRPDLLHVTCTNSAVAFHKLS